MRRAAAAFVLVLVSASAWSQAAPPRSITGILSVLESYQPDAGKIRALHEAAERSPPQTDDRLALKRFYVTRADARVSLGMVKEQVADLGKALEFTWPRDGDEFEIRLRLANAAQYVGQLSRAFALYAEAAAKASSGGQKQMAELNFAMQEAAYGGFAAARKHLAAAAALMPRLDGVSLATVGNLLTSNMERGRGNVALSEGRYAEAEVFLKNSIERHLQYMENFRRMPPHGNTEVGNLQLLGRVEGTLANAQRQLGKMVEAESTMRTVLERSLRLFGRYAPETALDISRLARVIFDQGRFDEAAELARATLETYRVVGALPSTQGSINSQNVLGAALAERGQYGDADAVFATRRRAIESDPEFAQRNGWESVTWAHAMVRLGRAAEAADMMKRAHDRSFSRFGPTFYDTAEKRGYLALALAAGGDRVEALAHFRAALPVLLKDARIGSEGEALARGRRLARILQGYVTLLAELHAAGQVPAGFDAVAEAFHIADAARGSRVQVALSASSARAAIRDPELARLAREAQDGSQRIGSLTTILLDLLSRPPAQQLPQVIAAMRRDVDELRKRQTALVTEIDRRFPEYASLVDPKPVTLEAAKRSLKPGESLISLLGTEDRTFIWAVPHSGQPAFATVALGAAERHAIVHKLRKALDLEPGVLLSEIPAFDVALAHALYQRLLVPVETGWKDARSLLVVPHGGLGQLPFAVLPTAASPASDQAGNFESYRQVPWLARRVSLTQLPSVTSLVTLRATKVERAPTRTFAGFGDPVFGKSASQLAPQPALLAAAAAPGLATRSVYLASRGGKPVDSAQLAGLPQLPDTAEEVRDIARALQADESRDVFLGVQASERQVKSMDLSDRRILLFATHGLIPGDLDGLSQPALALSNPAITGDKDDDGLLAVDEIVGLKLNADLVVLSACNTASGDGDGAEAVSGLGRAFFYAGARALLVSNWPVESASARLLTTDLFARVVKEPQLAPAEALRRAMLALIDQGTGRSGDASYSYAHPTFWAPFTLVGDGQGR